MVKCPKCNYPDADKAITHLDGGKREPKYRVVTWSCPKCNFSKEKKIEISKDDYMKATELQQDIEASKGGGIGLCSSGLIPTVLLFLPFMTIYPNQKALFFIIDFHKRKTSPMLNKIHFRCPFTPTCSEYSRIAMKEYGVFKGGFKSLYRILRCNPLNKNIGYDYP